jgi:hypothetical protein
VTRGSLKNKGDIFVHKWQATLAKQISTLRAELDVLQEGERTRDGETQSHITSELALLTKIAGIIERHEQKEMRKVVDRMSAARSRGR